jgi:site-specific DNA recombinase
MKAGLYARVSGEEQAEGYSIDEQLDAMRKFCDDKGWKIVEEYVDAGVSGTIKDRPAFTRALRAAEERKLDVLLTHQLDRFYRNLQLQLETMGQLGRWGVGYLSVTEQIDYSNPQGMLFMSILGSFNEYFVANLKRHVKKGKLGRAKSGLLNSPWAPYGYRWVGDKCDNLEIDEDRAEAVRFLFRKFSTGAYSYREVAALMDEQGFPPPGRSDRGRWIENSIYHMLSNRIYIGYVSYKGEGEDLWFPAQHEPIIDEGLWDAVQEAIEERGKKATSRRGKKVHLLSGLLACAHCQLPLYTVSPREPYTYYYCSSRTVNHPCPTHGAPLLRAEGLYQKVGALVKALRLPDDWCDRLEKLASENRGENIEAKQQYLRERMSRLKDLYELGDFDLEEYQRRKADLTRKLEALQPIKRPSLQAAARALESLQEVWEKTDEAGRRRLLLPIIDKIGVDQVAAEVVYIQPKPVFTPLFQQLDLEERDGRFYAGPED